jgi:hypothetical protein
MHIALAYAKAMLLLFLYSFLSSLIPCISHNLMRKLPTKPAGSAMRFRAKSIPNYAIKGDIRRRMRINAAASLR